MNWKTFVLVSLFKHFFSNDWVSLSSLSLCYQFDYPAPSKQNQISCLLFSKLGTNVLNSNHPLSLLYHSLRFFLSLWIFHIDILTIFSLSFAQSLLQIHSFCQWLLLRSASVLSNFWILLQFTNIDNRNMIFWIQSIFHFATQYLCYIGLKQPGFHLTTDRKQLYRKFNFIKCKSIEQ